MVGGSEHATYKREGDDKMTMQEIDLKKYWEDIAERLARYRASTDAYPDLAWRVMLGVFVLGTIIVGGGGWLVYQWAGTNDLTPVVGSDAGRSAIAPKDIRAVVETYEARRAAFEELKREAPRAPRLGAEVVAPTPTPTQPVATTTAG